MTKKKAILIIIPALVLLIFIVYSTIYLIDYALTSNNNKLIFNQNNNEININYVISKLKNDNNVFENIINFITNCNKELNCQTKKIDNNKYNIEINEIFFTKKFKLNSDINFNYIKNEALRIDLIGSYFIFPFSIMSNKEAISGTINIYKQKVIDLNKLEIDIVLKSNFFLKIKSKIEKNKTIVVNLLKAVFMRYINIIDQNKNDYEL